MIGHARDRGNRGPGIAGAAMWFVGGMKFGIATFVTDEGIRPGRLGRALEERGFDSLWLAEHSHIPVSRESPYPGGGDLPHVYYRTLDPFVALSAAASETSQLRLGTGVALLAQRDLIHAANEVASLDVISEGRALFGVGVGWNREEMRNHGTNPATRGALLNEQLAAVKAIWTQEQAEFHGKYVDFDSIYAWPKPLQRPHPPIYIGGESEPALARLAEFGDGWLPRAGTAPEQISTVRNFVAERGRSSVPATVFGAGRDEETLRGYAEAGVEGIAFMLGTKPESETLRDLDELAVLVENHR